jgi:hypothetical protein
LEVNTKSQLKNTKTNDFKPFPIKNPKITASNSKAGLDYNFVMGFSIFKLPVKPSKKN